MTCRRSKRSRLHRPRSAGSNPGIMALPRRIPAAPLPRLIAPENVQEGDMVSAEYPTMCGVIVTMRGTCAKRVEVGNRTQWRTAEGANLFSYSPGYPKNPRVTLLARAEYPQQTLSLFESLNERIGQDADC